MKYAYLGWLTLAIAGCSTYSATVIKVISDAGTNDDGGLGGSMPTGGASPSGGTQATGSSSAGSAATGGASGSLGGTAPGGTATGGKSTTGGALPTGGVATGGKSATGAALPTGGVPTGGVASGGAATGGAATCTIGSYAYTSGTKDPNNECASCQPGVSTSAWAPVADGTSCGTSPGLICRTGVCKTGCLIGSIYYDTGAVNPANPCLTCQSPASTSDWSSVPSAHCVQAISAGAFHTCAIVNGSALCWGANTHGELGANSTAASSTSPIQVEGLTGGVTAISTGDYQSCAVVNGAAQCWGYNVNGELGNGSTASSLVPVQVQNLTANVSTVTIRYGGGCALLGEVFAYCWGARYLGDNTSNSSLIPVRVQGIVGLGGSAITSVATGDTQSTCAIFNGGVQCWGFNNQGALGNGLTANAPAPVEVQGLSAGVTQISIHQGTQACAVVNGSAQCWGGNSFKELGAGSTSTFSSIPLQVSGLTSGVTAIDAGAYYTCAVVNGSAQCWGYNGYGALGDGTNVDKSVPVQVQGLTANVRAISAGFDHTCAIVNGSAYCWGDNPSGELGDGTTTARTTPVLVKLP